LAPKITPTSRKRCFSKKKYFAANHFSGQTQYDLRTQVKKSLKNLERNCSKSEKKDFARNNKFSSNCSFGNSWRKPQISENISQKDQKNKPFNKTLSSLKLLLGTC